MPKIRTPAYHPDTTFFTSDLHIGHVYASTLRNYRYVNDMHNTMIKNWNEQIKPTDHVFILGDLSFTGSLITISILGQLNGILHLIRGNHDKRLSNTVLKMFHEVNNVKEIKINDIHIHMSHYAHRVWNKQQYGAYHLYGHSHGSLPGIGRSMDVGIDTTDQHVPYSWHTICNRLSRIPTTVFDHHKIRLELT